ncbi:hypothetical protein HanIR_Chr11g0518091 [Helianthus annuus]|nr:hypothetical protein HanIR_Chr11g0518091 [Helianthus annuus]
MNTETRRKLPVDLRSVPASTDAAGSSPVRRGFVPTNSGGFGFLRWTPFSPATFRKSGKFVIETEGVKGRGSLRRDV